MRAWMVPAWCTDPAGLRLVERPEPAAGPGQVVVRVRAVSLNYRDQAVIRGQYMGGATTRDLIPASDGAGDVVSVGAGVSSVGVGARVTATFFQPTPQGPAALGSPLDGMLTASSRCPTASATRRRPACRAPASPPGARSSPRAGRSCLAIQCWSWARAAYRCCRCNSGALPAPGWS